jgi:WD40 repeat protein
LDWCPRYAHLFACGASDGSISVWNAVSDQMLRSIKTASSIVSLQWSRLSPELIVASNRGESDTGSVTLWNEKTLAKTDTLGILHVGGDGEESALSLALSTDGRRLCCVFSNTLTAVWTPFEEEAASMSKKKEEVRAARTKALQNAELQCLKQCYHFPVVLGFGKVVMATILMETYQVDIIHQR